MGKNINSERFIELTNNKHAEPDYWAEQLKSFLAQQKDDWDLLRDNYTNLKNVLTREFEFDGFKIKVQHNPARIRSSAAPVDTESISGRKCFLCSSGLPDGQKGIHYGRRFVILCNPYPIFNEHFTVSGIRHTPQLILGNFDEMLNLAKDLGKYYTVFYNGPESGSSAPDHMHFQAGNLGLMPIEHEYNRIKKELGRALVADDKIEIFGVEKYLRYFISLESAHKGELQYAFRLIYSSFKKIQKNYVEPLLNIITAFDGKKWRVIVFPRFKHRPRQFFASGKEQILISPASVDLGGVLIAPREEDFSKIDRDIITDIFNQVTINKEFFEYFKKKLGEAYSVRE